MELFKTERKQVTIDTFKSMADVASPPRIVFTTSALMWMKALVETHDQEVGWIGLVSKIDTLGKDGEKVPSLLIKKIFYPKHKEMHSTTCEIDSTDVNFQALGIPDNATREQLAEIAEAHGFLDEFNQPGCDNAYTVMTAHPDATMINESLRLWGHSHHTMGISPSGQDEEQGLSRVKACQDYYIRVICNKSGLIGITYYDFVGKNKYSNMEFFILKDSEEAKAEDAFIALKRSDIDEKFTDVLDAKEKEELLANLVKKYQEKNPSKEYAAIKEKIISMKDRNSPKSYAQQQQQEKIVDKGYPSTWDEPSRSSFWDGQMRSSFHPGGHFEWNDVDHKSNANTSIANKVDDANQNKRKRKYSFVKQEGGK
jgi:hypothetical protein